MAQALRNKIAVISNPVSGCRASRRKLNEVTQELHRLGVRVELYETKARGDAANIAKSIIDENFDAIAVAGGDGTINEVANAIIGSPLPLAVIPTGTINLLARELGLPKGAKDLAEIIARGPSHQIFPCYAGDHLFLVVASVGFDARVVNNVSLSLKRAVGVWAYVFASFKQWIGDSFPPLKLEIEGRSSAVSGLVVANGRYYAGPFMIAEKASVFSPKFDLCLFTGQGRWSLIRLIGAIVRGSINSLDQVEILRPASFTISGPPDEPVQADGDIIGRTPITITTSQKTLHLITPAPSTLQDISRR
ncbi:MAG: diacylglycerol kinase family lipid kinase [Rhodospirillales bacterium]|nr:diacylglycerol kinase family lipid kinase [Rhodospirillales bacterium]